ncbi:DNA mismatch repair protein MSH5 [Nasonia vitripennis]|uniref:Reverse transcriptase domain-containing protein n=2 Tax=Nasonia vitripennis TaxID=7425 RepID=A0A7M7Q114_NASVI|nr:DNA mismatch repair protein MSH5 [Nasonia vitripennis]
MLLNEIDKYYGDYVLVLCCTALCPLKTYISARQQKVVTKSFEQSDKLSTNLGVPQGSVLGSLLFSLHINNIAETLSISQLNHLLYADDLQIYKQVEMSELDLGIARLADVARSVSAWARDSGLYLNVLKTIFFGSVHNVNALNNLGLPGIELEAGALVPFTDTVKNLEVVMDSKLSWKPHVKCITKRVNRALHGLKFFRTCTTEALPTSIYFHLPETLSTLSKTDILSLPPEIENYNLVYVPEVGYVIAVTKWRSPALGNKNILNLEYKFTTRNIHYYKNYLTKELDKAYGDINQSMIKRSSRIIMKLALYMNFYIETIYESLQKCAELDALISLFQIAKNNNYVKPHIVKERKIAIKCGRHPLLEQTHTFIPNDTYSESTSNLLKIIMGPSSCGKSTYVQQVALIIFLAHIGSYVPANQAVIGLVSQIYSKLFICESSSLESSSFLQDIRQVTESVGRFWILKTITL